jgi:hypothetical protein
MNRRGPVGFIAGLRLGGGLIGTGTAALGVLTAAKSLQSGDMAALPSSLLAVVVFGGLALLCLAPSTLRWLAWTAVRTIYRMIAGTFSLGTAVVRRLVSRPAPADASPLRSVQSSASDVGREPISAGLRFDVFNRDHFRCRYCGRGRDEGAVLHVDHVIPVAQGGRTEIGNLVTACAACNLGKSAKGIV